MPWAAGAGAGAAGSSGTAGGMPLLWPLLLAGSKERRVPGGVAEPALRSQAGSPMGGAALGAAAAASWLGAPAGLPLSL